MSAEQGYTPNTPEVRVDYSQFWGGVAPDDVTDAAVAFDRWLKSVRAEVWDAAYQVGAYDTLHSPADATENPYRSES